VSLQYHLIHTIIVPISFQNKSRNNIGNCNIVQRNTLLIPQFFFWTCDSRNHGHRATPIPNPHSLLHTPFPHLSTDSRHRPPQLRCAAELLWPPAPSHRWNCFFHPRSLENRSSRRTHRLRGTEYHRRRLGFDFVAKICCLGSVRVL